MAMTAPQPKTFAPSRDDVLTTLAMERAKSLLAPQEAQVDENEVIDVLYELKELEPTPEVVYLATKLEGIVIVYLMSEWELSVDNVLTDYMNLRKRTTETDFESEMQSIAIRAGALKDATVLSNPERASSDEVDKRVVNLREVIKHVEDFFS